MADTNDPGQGTIDNNFILYDRLEKIRQVVGQYGEDRFSISFSGGKDSTVLSDLVDRALPGNQIPRVFIDTGIEYNAIRAFVKAKQDADPRFHMVQPTKPINKVLETYGYPFKSKEHSAKLSYYQRGIEQPSLERYLSDDNKFGCPKILRYQFTHDFTMPISNLCCDKLKKEPMKLWQKENRRPISIIGVIREEGGQRRNAKCIVTNFRGTVKAFQPLVAVTLDWEQWYIDTFNIQLCELYYPPFSFERTGCKGCPFAIGLQAELDTMQRLLPGERKQCESIWAPVYEEYRRIGYRLRKNYSKAVVTFGQAEPKQEQESVPACAAEPVAIPKDHSVSHLLSLLETERKCVETDDCDKDCGKCDLARDQSELEWMYDTMIRMITPLSETIK